MMNKYLMALLICAISTSTISAYEYAGSTTGVVVVVGSIIKGLESPVKTKYKRKDCPVCLGKGYYVSGDGIMKVDCGYCEPDKNTASSQPLPLKKCDKYGCPAPPKTSLKK
jgi:hypothetical protein